MSIDRKFSEILNTNDPKRILDLIHYLRVQYATNLYELSNQTRTLYNPLLDEIPNGPGIYLILIVDPTGNAILYAGRTSGTSDTSGLNFRIKDHIRFLAKTPLTIFLPNWWVSKVYPIPLEDKELAKLLEKKIWEFLDNTALERIAFSQITDLEMEVFALIKSHVPDFQPNSIELNTNLSLNRPFTLSSPPAGRPRGL